jgi:hypothetical protein
LTRSLPNSGAETPLLTITLKAQQAGQSFTSCVNGGVKAANACLSPPPYHNLFIMRILDKIGGGLDMLLIVVFGALNLIPRASPHR